MAEVFDFGLQQHKIKMDGKFFESNLFAVAGDTGRRLEVQLLDSNNMVQNTTGISLRLNANVAGQATYAEATLVDATKGLYELDLPNGMLIAPGNWQFQWQIIGATGEKLHSFAFTGSVGSNLSEGGSEATNFYLNVDDLKQMQDDLINGTFNSEVLETNIAEKLNNLETQYAPKLAETENHINSAEIDIKFMPAPFMSAKGDGVTDDTSVINNALQLVSESGGTVFIPAGKFVFTSKLNVTNRSKLKGVGMTEADEASTGSVRRSVLLKKGDFDGIDLTNASIVEDLSLEGANDLTGYGIKLNGNRASLINVLVTGMGGDGVLIGDPVVEGNRNHWRLINVISRANNGNGFVFDDLDPGYGPDANAGFAEQCQAYGNGGNGFSINNAQVNTFIQCYAENNGANGWLLKEKAKSNTFITCGSEQNALENFLCDAGSVNNLIFGSYNYTVVDNGYNTCLVAQRGTKQSLMLSRTLGIGLGFNSAVDKGLMVRGKVPGLALYEEDGGLNEKQWELFANNGILQLRTTSDDGSLAKVVFEIDRDGQAIRHVKFKEGNLYVNGGIGVANHSLATTLGNVTRKMEIFNQDGNSLGWIPIYNNIN